MSRAANAELEYGEFCDGIREEEPEPGNITGEQAIREQTGEWFDSDDGLRTIEGLRSHLEQHRDAIKLPTHSAEDFERYRAELLEEFKLCERFLKEAVASRQRFRLVVVP